MLKSKKEGWKVLIKPDVLIKTRRKTLSLTINQEGELIVRAPEKMPINEVYNFLIKKEKWIKQKQGHIINILKANEKILNYEQVLFLGKLYSVVRVKGIKKVSLEGGFLCIPASVKPEKVQKTLKNWLNLLAEDIILDRLDYFAELMALDFDSVKIVASKAKWGSCDADNNLSFNFKMVMLTPKLIDYIIIHELAHILQFNHSKQFWDVVKSIIPNYKKQRELLQGSNFLLRLFTGKP